MCPRALKNGNYFESYLKFLKNIEIWTLFAITYSKFNETTSFWTHFKDNFYGFHMIKSTKFITHRIGIKII